MKRLLLISLLLFSCTKTYNIKDINVKGGWLVKTERYVSSFDGKTTCHIVLSVKEKDGDYDVDIEVPDSLYWQASNKPSGTWIDIK